MSESNSARNEKVCRKSKSRGALLSAAVATVAAFSPFGPKFAQANTELDVVNGQTDLTAAGSYTQATAPTTASDITFDSGTTYSPTAFTINPNSLSVGTLDDLDGTQSLSITNTNTAVTNVFTLNGGTNSVAPNAGDLIYVASGGTLAINGTSGTSTNDLTMTIGAAGNFDIAGTATISTQITDASALTLTGGGTLTFAQVPAVTPDNTLTGGFTISNGTLVLGGATNAPNFELGASGSAVTIGNSASNATLEFISTASGPAQTYTIGGTGTDTIENDAGSPTAGNAAIFAAGQSMTLANNLTVTNLVAESSLNSNILGFRDNILQSGVTNFGITVASSNVGTVDFRGTNTFTGGVTIDGGAVTFNLSTTPNTVGSTVTSGPFGTGTVTLGGSPTTAALIGDGGSFTEANPIIVGSTSNGSARTIEEISASTTAGTFNGPMTLNGDLTLTAVTSTAVAEDRLRVGGGGITGSNNIIVNNPNTGITTSTLSPIALVGGAIATTWTGNLIINQGVGTLRTATAITANNIVSVASGAAFSFAENTAFSPTIAGLNNITGAGGTVLNAQTATSVALNLGGTGAYSFSGTIQDSATAGVTSALVVNMGSASASQTLSGASTYSGGTTITQGNLILSNSTGSGTGGGAVALSGGTTATISGTGIATGAVTVTAASNITPATAGTAGTLSLGTTGGLTLTSATLHYDLATTNAVGGGVNDLVSTSALTLGTLVFNFNELGGSLDATGDLYTLISGTAVPTGFNAADITTSFSSGPTYTPTYSIQGDNLDVSFAAVPEPASAALLGLAGCFALGRRRTNLKRAVQQAR